MPEGLVPVEALTADDQAALGWAAQSGHPLGTAVVERLRAGDGSSLTVAVLAAIRGDWEQAGRPVAHRHVHRTPVTFADGTTVVGVSFAADDPDGRNPAFGLYLDERWAPPWPHRRLDWPDFGVPASVHDLRAALVDLLDRARGGEVVEVGCIGGHGRTGTALACLAVLTGTPTADAVAWVRAHYCDRAVETPEQEAFVARFAP